VYVDGVLQMEHAGAEVVPARWAWPLIARQRASASTSLMSP